ncbi:MAG: DsbA family protein [Enhydrobacter sp.]|nr:MAG: DsbA family protein [Enhydrobacter sp.]
MRFPLLILCAVLIVAGAFVAFRTGVPPTAAASLSPSDKTTFGKSVRDYLLANPEVLVEAMQELERKQDSQRDAVAQRAIRTHQEALLRDPDSPVAGNPDGDVTVVEFNDYQCPYCKRAHTAVKAVLATDPKVRLVLKDLPILGEPSRIAALAALAARKQGKHGEMHDALLGFNGKLDRERIFEIAGSVGLDVPKLQEDMEDPKLREIIERNAALASELGVRGTPAFVVGGHFVPGAVDADTLRQLIAEARRKG